MRTQSSPAILRLAAMVAAALVLFAGAPVARAQGRCGAGVDLVVQALEKMRADSGSSELEDANQLLKRAAELCGELGNAWYYRSLVERKLGHAALADFAMRQAQKFPSDASSEQANPFVLAAPLSRAVTGPGTTAGPSDHPADRWALIIGIGSFTDQHIPRLQYTASDAQSFAATLEDPKIGDSNRTTCAACLMTTRPRRTSRSN